MAIKEEQITTVVTFLTEAGRLEQVLRAGYIGDASRHENSAEHSWQLALGMLVLACELEIDIDLSKAVAMALIHDMCEIDAGDTPIFEKRCDQLEAENRCIERLVGYGLKFGEEMRNLWHEYEAQKTRESRWVRVMDRFLPFIGNLATQGKSWRDRSITRSQVLHINETTWALAPEIYSWMVKRIDECVEQGWLRDA